MIPEEGPAAVREAERVIVLSALQYRHTNGECSAPSTPAGPGARELSRRHMAAAAGVKVTSRFNMILNAGKATPQPPVGSALGQRGLNLMNFCKAFNDETAKFKDTVPIRVRAAHRPHRTPRALRTRRCKRLQVRVTAYADRTFTFQTQGPSSTYLLLKAAGIEKGADKPGYETVGKLSVKHIYEIAKVRPAKIEWSFRLRLRLAQLTPTRTDCR